MNQTASSWLRWFVIAAAGAATFLLTFRAVDGSPDIVQPVALRGDRPDPMAKSVTRGHDAPQAQDALDLPSRTKFTQSVARNPFAPKDWSPPPRPVHPPPAPVLAPPPPPVPTAPPMPFRFMGLMEDNSAEPAAFITKGDALYVVHVGDVVENTYRVESFNTAQVVVTYLPLQQRQSIDMPGG